MHKSNEMMDNGESRKHGRPLMLSVSNSIWVIVQTMEHLSAEAHLLLGVVNH